MAMNTDNPEYFHVTTVESTNDVVRDKLGIHPRVFVCADSQTGGKGRKGKKWTGEHGQNIYCSYGTVHDGKVDYRDLASYMARGALATVLMLREITPRLTFKVKYPNDVMVLDTNRWKKIGGILVEHEFRGAECRFSIIGIGVNINQLQFPEELQETATSLIRLGAITSLPQCIRTLHDNLISQMRSHWQHVHRQWVQEMEIINKPVNIVGSKEQWLVKSVLDDGRLVAQNIVTQTERVITDGDTIRYNY
ncbi:MAG: biotin--[acetyl-CoA-carboxylase] ligase [Chlorobi bacterium]|nr:MAG: biotin--[acetyl-CoA-carboxylase] ligase [Bacteroidota bacterium]MBE2265931.1 biotin--[acetyl-CoA-carboxylase] ligase [Flavobacteriales bacterium]MBL1160908.1 biotin--[acetyl-CoA-carboxylase] ligase [Chlorobiota bacterium]MBZ0193773.1 biotin--[acetyl-CoA-carboxylase] ligase [Candidatus Kapabacteria bacterium]MCC6330900.1 biotin--[acetyl-CoA-carboxylase] ligase [Ignavibacteria bacterium]